MGKAESRKPKAEKENVLGEMAQHISTIVHKLTDETPDITLERPARAEHGDWSCNVALRLAKPLKKNPLEIAKSIADQFPMLSFVSKVEAVAPGFINFHLSNEYHYKKLAAIVEDFGQGTIGKGKQVMVEFGQPNTHKAITVGHLKSAVSGLASVRLHENLGYEVIKANYFGDIGMQVAKSTWGFLHKGKPDNWATMSTREQMDYIAECYVYGANQFKEDPRAEEEMRVVNKKIYSQEPGLELETYRELRAISIESQDEFFAQLGIVYDRQYPESEVAQQAIKVVEKYKNDLFTQSEGAWIYDGKKEGLTTWVFLTKDGNPTYSAKDLALGEIKFKEYPHLEKSIVHTSIEIIDYFKVVIKLLEKIVPASKGKYFHLPFGWLLFSNRKLSSRTGGVPKAADVIDDIVAVAKQKIGDIRGYSAKEQEEIARKVALAGLKFVILSHEFISNINYNPEQFLSLEGFSGPYLLYSYARSQSIARKGEYKHKQLAAESLAVLSQVTEIALLKKLELLPEVAERSAVNSQPHLLATYLFEVAQAYNQWYNEVPIMAEKKKEVRGARLFLNWAAGTVLKNGLHALGIETLEKM